MNFVIETFPKEQQEAVMTLMEGKQDVFVSMPTGSGKSLVYQLPAVAATGKVTVVVAPLLALIKDQFDHLAAKNIVAASINSKMKKTDRTRIINDLKSPKPTTQLLYVTPELCGTQEFQGLLQGMVDHNVLAYIAIDEAHCVSQWGHSFRPEYLNLGQLRQITGSVPWVALTATASTKMVSDIVSALKLSQDFKTFKLPCFRSNLFYDVIFKDTVDVSIFGPGGLRATNVVAVPSHHILTQLKRISNWSLTKKNCSSLWVFFSFIKYKLPAFGHGCLDQP